MKLAVVGICFVSTAYAATGDGEEVVEEEAPIEDFPDRSTIPILSPEAIEVFYELDHVPAAIDVDQTNGKVYFSYHPAGRELENELFPTSVGCRIAVIDKKEALGVRDKRAIKIFPNDEVQATMGIVHSIRIDSKKRLLYALDHGDGAPESVREPRLHSIDLDDPTRIVHTYVFPHEDTNHFNHFGEMVLSRDGRHIWVADRGTKHTDPSIIVYDTNQGRSWRALDGHNSVKHKEHGIEINGVALDFPLKMGVDTMAEDETGEWLYFSSAFDQHVWRVRTASLAQPAKYSKWLGALEGEDEPERMFQKTTSDGMVVDEHGQIYMADVQNSAVSVIQTRQLNKFKRRMAFGNGAVGNVTTLVQDTELLRWPNSLAIGGTGNEQQKLYITCSVSHELHIQEQFKDAEHVESDGPFHIFSVRIWPHPRRLTPISLHAEL